MTVLWSPESDRIYGEHSNIPACCVEFYINTWKNRPMAVKLAAPNYLVGWGYIPCNVCITRNNKKPVHICTWDCVPFLMNRVGMDQRRACRRAVITDLLHAGGYSQVGGQISESKHENHQ